MMKKIFSLDKRVAFIFPEYYQNNLLSRIMKFISAIGDFGMFWLVLILALLVYRPTYNIAIRLLAALVFSIIISQVIIKSIVRRKRPCHLYQIDMLIPIPNDFSFPSSHTMTCFACATVCLHFSIIGGIIFMIFSCFMGLSRMYLFVHFLSDVLAGMVFGIIVGMIIMAF